MCLAIPAQIVKFIDDNYVLADFGKKVRREISIALMDETLEVGDWLLIHTGYAVSKMEPQEAEETLLLWEEIWRHEKEGNLNPRGNK